ncbi:hypothetical protein J6590_025913 [Homalodisca vitripennis]|nr:hypothetical protein J6590_025913 [Homalodisca vitripennis]
MIDNSYLVLKGVVVLSMLVSDRKISLIKETGGDVITGRSACSLVVCTITTIYDMSQPPSATNWPEVGPSSPMPVTAAPPPHSADPYPAAG